MIGSMLDIRQDYFEWLCEIVHADQIERSWWILMKELHRLMFKWKLPRDENRASDGLSLRDEYLGEIWYPKYVDIDIGDCTMLEMLIGLARRMDFETRNPDPYQDESDDKTAYWFWEMIDNLGLMRFSDDAYAEYSGIYYVEQIVNRLLERGYGKNGEGGLFPLKHPDRDQRKIEIWLQMNAYLIEHDAS